MNLTGNDMKKLVVGLLALCALMFQGLTVMAADAPPVSAASKNIEALVNKAAAEIDKRGAAAFPDFRKKGSEWLAGQTYIFVYNSDGVVLVNGAFPQAEGNNSVTGGNNANAQSFSARFMETVKTKGSGWVDYMYAKPGQTELSQKWSYVTKVMIDGKPGLVGAGFYPQ
jgi:cytochrome c